ncbi:unnamed protein product [Bursaphelenchus xylophilus]|uniref:(pine wood nematode) hypothetical protein n=1 Tax=Bursaphelenchus xylophilus TaxID=6326 RepID=A0A7I8X339_BURXY|nr:unnamed protein product [Bursaphelenchus xylophilus]CAG9128180.1 unnamed protein product [Bursaphelenchus xylophilus]
MGKTGCCGRVQDTPGQRGPANQKGVQKLFPLKKDNEEGGILAEKRITLSVNSTSNHPNCRDNPEEHRFITVD